MLFNSWMFVGFFSILFPIYIVFGRYLGLVAQNRLLLVASYIFYASWDWRFCSLLLAISVVDWFCSKLIHASENKSFRRAAISISVVFDIGILVYFKYLNFFIQSAADGLGALGVNASWPTLHIILPVGISFIVFKSLSYTIDVYRKEIPPEQNFLDYALFVAFFPDLVAGPIIRAKTVLAQLHTPRRITEAMITEGIWLILFGYFLKVVVADNLAPIANTAFSTDHPQSWLHALVGVYAFAFQILGDFAGYSSIAIGVARLMGFVLPPNFGHPYLQTNPQNFWRHWHISLSTWLRDYAYISFGGSRGGFWKTNRNLMATMLLGGLWHGAAWTFLVWGLYHGVLLVGHRMLNSLRVPFTTPSWSSAISRPVAILIMFQLTCIGWLLFRAQSMAQVGGFLKALTTRLPPSAWEEMAPSAATVVMLALATIVFDHLLRAPNGGLHPLKLSVPGRWATAICLAFAILSFGDFGLVQFLYFQF
jgi:D-alanyl-lipoteichoic acid acyltransferase DltB (MBOAT superfamily)